MKYSVVAVLLGIAQTSRAADWARKADIDGMTIEVRSVAGSAFEEIRIRANSVHTTQRLCEAVWGDGDMKVAEPGFKLRRVLRQQKDERWTYEQIATPIVSDRDYTMYARRMTEPELGVCQVFFETRNQDGPPPQPGFVRIPRIAGSWTLEPNDGRGSLITYVIFSEPGGAIPAWLSRGAQRENAVSWMKRILARAE